MIFLKGRKCSKMKLLPFVKWAGGKRQIMNELLKYVPSSFNCYFEPFVGGGALLLELAPNKAFICDINEELLCVYKCLKWKKYYSALKEELRLHELNHSEAYYYEVRNWDHNISFKTLPIEKKAARMIYLNKAGFNGLYRVNSQGYFNVPFGKKEKVHIFDEENLDALHDYFNHHAIYLRRGDFTLIVPHVKKGDFIYFDPPYDTLENKDSFTSYSKDQFGKKEQIRLFECFDKLAKRGAYVMLSNHNTKFINELYKDYHIHIIHAKRMINSDATKRGDIEEVIITNYE